MKTINYKYNKIAVVLPLCLGQLIREDNRKRNQTYLYEYDDAGNITAFKVSTLTAAGTTPITKAASIGFVHLMNKTVESIVDNKHTLKSTLNSPGGRTTAFIFLAHEVYNVMRSLQTDNPEERANERGYQLQ